MTGMAARAVPVFYTYLFCQILFVSSEPDGVSQVRPQVDGPGIPVACPFIQGDGGLVVGQGVQPGG